MKRTLANLFLSIAIRLGAKRVCVQVIKDSYSQAAADAIFQKCDWQPESAADLHKYLRTENGQLLSTRMRRIAAEVAVNGAQDRQNTIHAAGYSAGWNDCVRHFHSLSRVSRVEDTNSEQTPQDEASLLDQLSP